MTVKRFRMVAEIVEEFTLKPATEEQHEKYDLLPNTLALVDEDGDRVAWVANEEAALQVIRGMLGEGFPGTVDIITIP